MSSATGVWPTIRSRFTQTAIPSTTPMVASVLSPVLRKISTSGSSSTSITVPKVGSAPRGASSMGPRVAGTGRTKRLPAQRPKR